MMKICSALAAAVLVVAMLACSSGPAPKTNPDTGGQTSQGKPSGSQATQTVTGREAFQQLYATARLWAADARPYREQSGTLKDASGHDGKAAIWNAGFASPSRRGLKNFSWSGTHDPDAPAFGVSSNVEDTYSPSNSSTLIFDIAFLKTDSDTAFAEAQKHGGDKLLKKDPKTPVSYVLDWQPQANSLYWHVIYGDPAQPSLRIAVDATKGAFVRVEH